MSYKRLSLLFAIDTLVLVPFRTFGSLYFLSFMSAVDVGFLYALYNLGRAFGMLIGGPLADRFGRKKPLIFAYPIGLALYILVLQDPRIFMPIASFFRSIYVIATDVSIYETSEEKTFGYALMLSFTDISYVLGLLTFSHIFGDNYFGLVDRMYALSIPGALLGLFIAMTIKMPEIKSDKMPHEAYISILSDKRILTYVILVTIYRLWPPIFALFMVPMLYFKGIEPTLISYILSASAIVEAVLSPYVSRIMSVTTMYLIGQALRGVPAMLIPFLSQKPLIIGLYFVYTINYGLTGPAGSTMDATVMPEESRATGVSLVRLTTTITRTIGSSLAGVLRTYYGYITMTIAAIVTMINGLIIGLYVRKVRRIRKFPSFLFL